MAEWPPSELERFGGADEIGLASRRPDGSLRPFAIIWVVEVGGELYVRSAFGRDNPWFRRAAESGQGRIRADGLERDVSFEEPDEAVGAAITEAYHAKYDRYPKADVDPVVSDESVGATLRLVPR